MVASCDLPKTAPSTYEEAARQLDARQGCESFEYRSGASPGLEEAFDLGGHRDGLAVPSQERRHLMVKGSEVGVLGLAWWRLRGQNSRLSGSSWVR